MLCHWSFYFLVTFHEIQSAILGDHTVGVRASEMSVVTRRNTNFVIEIRKIVRT